MWFRARSAPDPPFCGWSFRDGERGFEAVMPSLSLDSDPPLTDTVVEVPQAAYRRGLLEEKPGYFPGWVATRRRSACLEYRNGTSKILSRQGFDDHFFIFFQPSNDERV